MTRAVPGWAGAGLAAEALLSGAAALALITRPRVAPRVLDLGAPPPTLAALSAPQPQAVDHLQEAEAAEDAPDSPPPLPQADDAPTLLQSAPMTAPLLPEALAQTDLTLPPPLPEVASVLRPKPRPKAGSPAKETKKAEPGPKPKADPAAKAKAKAKADPPPQAAAEAAPTPRATVKGGAAVSPATYAKAVMRKVRATRPRSGGGPGRVVVGFTIAGDGGLAGVPVLESSGNAELDAVALQHIRRSAPFPAPPKDAGRSYAFAFVGR